jgi:hypothetical protein
MKVSCNLGTAFLKCWRFCFQLDVLRAEHNEHSAKHGEFGLLTVLSYMVPNRLQVFLRKVMVHIHSVRNHPPAGFPLATVGFALHIIEGTGMMLDHIRWTTATNRGQKKLVDPHPPFVFSKVSSRSTGVGNSGEENIYAKLRRLASAAQSKVRDKMQSYSLVEDINAASKIP